MNKTNLEQYRNLKQAQKALEEELSNLSLAIIDEMNAESKDKLALADNSGVFTLSKRKSWTYSPTVAALELSVKTQKSEEQAKGIAEYTEKDVLIFTVPTVKE